MPKPLGKGYIHAPQTLGNHIRNKRLQMRLSQREVADLIGVEQMSISHWERDKAEPQTGHLPKIVQFLGYNPRPAETETFGSRLQYARLLKGLDSLELAGQIGVSTKAILRWESNINRPRHVKLEKLSRVLNTEL